MSTSRSRQTKNPNVLTTEDFANLGNSDEEDNDNHTPKEEREVDKKLAESIPNEDLKGLSWHEKKALVKGLSASVNTAKYEKRIRSSPRFGGSKSVEVKSPSQKPKETIIPIDVENSDATNSNEENNKDLNEGASLTNIKKTGSINPFVSAFQSIKNVFGLKSDVPDTDKPEICEKINSPKLRSDSENNDNHINFSKKSDLLVTDKKITIDLSSDEDSEKIFHSSKKRPSPPDTDRFNCIKRLKMDRTSNQVNKTSRTPLKTEIEIAKKQQSVPFKRRNIEAILNELGMVHKMYKEASVKYRFPVRWGTPIVKNCERWDSQNIPKKLIDRYHKYLTNNDLGPPAFVPPTHEFETSAVVEPLRNYQAIEDDDDEDLFRTNTRSRSKDELNTDFERKTELKVILDNVEQENVKNTPKQGSSRKTRAGRSQQKKIDVDYDPGAGDENDKGIESHQDQDSEEWLPKNERRPKKNGKASKQDVPEKGSKSKKDDVIHLSQESENSQPEKEMETISDGELVDCPICSNKFKTDQIENHAQECATKTFQD